MRGERERKRMLEKRQKRERREKINIYVDIKRGEKDGELLYGTY